MPISNAITFPIPNDTFEVLIEKIADFDPYANLSEIKPSIDGMTEFFKNKKPKVSIAKELQDPENEYRLRTTLTHEFGHALLHEPEMANASNILDLFPEIGNPQIKCKRESIGGVSKSDWKEYQAGYVCTSLLMPITYFKYFVLNFFKKENAYAPLVMGSPIANRFLNQVSREFNVSKGAVKKRLSQLKYSYFLTDKEVQPSLF